jgi:membrane glycosyltransferase
MWFGHTVFLVGLLFGRRIGWIGQTRDDHSVPLAIAVRNFWPQTLLGVTCLAILTATHPAAIPIASFIAAGLAFSIPLAILTSSPHLGDAMARIGLCGLPEERDMPPALRTLVRAGAAPQPA